MFKKIKAALGYSATNKVISREAEYKLYEQVARDIAEGEKDEGVWTLAFAKSEGNSQKTEALYIELMVQRYKDEMDASIELLEKSQEEAQKKKEIEEAKKENAKRKEEETERERERAEEFAKAREAEERELEREREREKEKKKEEEIQKRKETENLIINSAETFSKPTNFSVNIVISFTASFILMIILFTTQWETNNNNLSIRKSTSFEALDDLTYTEYNSVHDDTYWFVNEEATLEGFYIGTVRSNLVWADRMSVFLNESNCGLEDPEIFMILTTNKFTKEYPSFDYTSLKNQTIELNMDFDGKYFENNTAIIEHVHDLENGNHAFQLHIPGIYNTFLGVDQKYNTLFWQFLTIKVADDDPSRKYFDLPERQYRMLGFSPVMVSLIEQCKMDIKAK